MPAARISGCVAQGFSPLLALALTACASGVEPAEPWGEPTHEASFDRLLVGILVGLGALAALATVMILLWRRHREESDSAARRSAGPEVDPATDAGGPASPGEAAAGESSDDL